MTRSLISEHGIGTIIKQFEQEKEQNIETFNRLFYNCKLLGYEPHLSVTIGEYNSGRREITINDNITLFHELSLIDKTMGEVVTKRFILYYPNGDEIGRFSNFLAAAEFLDHTTGTLKSYIEKKIYVQEFI
jgi:hypothetical protein